MSDPVVDVGEASRKAAADLVGEKEGPTAEGARDESEERRSVDRAPVTLRVDYKRLNTFFADYTRNISSGGTFIRTEEPLPVGTEFIFELTVPKPGAEPQAGEPPPTVRLALAGVVRWIVPSLSGTGDDAAGTPGMGIQFQFADDAERARVESLVAQLMRDSLGPRLAEKLLANRS